MIFGLKIKGKAKYIGSGTGVVKIFYPPCHTYSRKVGIGVVPLKLGPQQEVPSRCGKFSGLKSQVPFQPIVVQGIG